ncbi:MAG: hypothetical protein HY901_02555 [Deltaproteobacteria bacterium]|nr:hypothetical protein [Deltaproteobacteria bacterium]
MKTPARKLDAKVVRQVNGAVKSGVRAGVNIVYKPATGNLCGTGMSKG